MPDRVVALQLLSSYWLAVILPPLPGILCFSAIYNNERISALSALSPYFHQGRKFSGYKILPKPCKDTSSTEKENVGICMFNYECTQRAGTVVGSCMDGFLYGTCCKLPTGVSISTVDVPETTSPKPLSLAQQSERSTTIVKPHIQHSPEETLLLFKNGTIVQNVYSPDDFLMFTKQQTPLYMHTSPLPDTELLDTKVQETDDTTESTKRATPYLQKMTTFTNYNGDLQEQSSNNINPSHLNDLAVSFAKIPSSTVSSSAKPFFTTTSSREPFSPNFSSSKYSSPTKYTTKLSTPTTPKSSFHSVSTRFTTYQTAPSFYTPNTNKIDIYDEEENLIRVPTLTADGAHRPYGSNNSIGHILWLLNDTKHNAEEETDMSTIPTQSFHTWLSVQNNADKTSSPYFSTKPLLHSSYYDSRPSTPIPGTTVHHIPGPSFHVTPEVKITPKPQSNTADSAPTVIVLTSAQESSTKKPVHSYSTTTASYNVSYHIPHLSTTSNKVHVKPSYSPKPSSTYNLLITAKPSQISYSSIRPITGYISKPISDEIDTSPKPSVLFTTLPIGASYKPLKAPTSVHTMKPQNEFATSTLPAFLHTTVVTTAKPILGGNVNSGNIESVGKPVYSPIPSYSNAGPTLSTTSYVTLKPPTTNLYGITPVHSVFGDHSPLPMYPPGPNVFFNSTEDLLAFPPDRHPNVNLTATQQERPVFSTTTYIDDDFEGDVTPPFAVDKTMEDKMHVFVEKIVQSLQGNFEDLEKVLITGESTDNVTVSNSNTTKKPATISKKPTKKPTGSSGKPTTLRPAKPAITTLPITYSTVITKKPSKRPPSLATPVILFSPTSSTQGTVNIPTKKPIKITTTVSISSVGSTDYGTAEEISSSSTTNKVDALEEEEDEVPPTDFKRECGVRPLARKNGRIVGGKGSTFGDWPWQVLVREATWLGLFTKNKCGGVLITNKYVITAAHCQPGFLANLVAVFGEYDISGEVESKRSISKNVRRVIVHRQYDAATFENDIALLELESAIQFDSHIVPICMPEDDDDFTGRVATVTGWGRLKYGGGVPSVLQEVHVPVIENRVCQEMFQTAGHSKVILSSFLCAGYANGQKDSCEGDSGGPLMVERSDGHWVLVATVSHGIKCAAPYLPGVYMRTTYYKPWLQTITGV